jgi:hypothetical protein
MQCCHVAIINGRKLKQYKNEVLPTCIFIQSFIKISSEVTGGAGGRHMGMMIVISLLIK